MTNQKDREIGRSIVAAVFANRMVTYFAFAAQGKIPAKCKSVTAIGALSAKTAAQSGQKAGAASFWRVVGLGHRASYSKFLSCSLLIGAKKRGIETIRHHRVVQ